MPSVLFSLACGGLRCPPSSHSCLLAVTMLAQLSGRKVVVPTYIMGKLTIGGKIELPVRKTIAGRSRSRNTHTISILHTVHAPQETHPTNFPESGGQVTCIQSATTQSAWRAS